MFKQKQKKLVKRIILSAMLGILIFFTAPAGITNNAAYAEDTPQDAACKTHFGVVCSEVTEKQYKDSCPAYDQCKGYEEFKKALEGTPKSTVDIESAKKTIDFLVQAQKFLNRLIWPILFMIGGLMDNSLLFGSGMEARLREIWIPIRNIVNMLFVIVLVGIALYNVLGIGDENGSYSIKAILPKIVVGIIAVNFSFIGIKVFLDAINVLTVSVFTLPSQIDEGLGRIITAPDAADANTIKRLCRAFRSADVEEKATPAELEAIDNLTVHRVVAGKYQSDSRYATLFKDKIKSTDNISQIDGKVQKALSGNQVALDQYQKDLKLKKGNQICNGDFLSPYGKAYLSRWNSRNAALAMAINMGKIVFYQDVPVDVAKIEQLAINTIFSFMMWLIYAASFVALFVVLLARLVVMWLAIALSPVLLLMLAVPAIKEQISGFGEIQSKFVQNAIAPLGIALSMTIGWVMLRALQGIDSIGGDSIIALETGGATIPVVGLNTLQDLIVALGTVAVVWLGVFTAASSSIAAPVTDWMKGGLQKAGSFLGTLPLKHVPLVPITIKGQKGTYTGEEVLEGLRVIGNKAPSQRLADKLRPDGQKDMSILRQTDKIKDAEGVARAINTNAGDLNDGKQASIDEIVNLKKTNRTAWESLIRHPLHGRAIEDAVKKYEGSKKEEPERKDLGKTLTRLASQISNKRLGDDSSTPTPAIPANLGQPITATSPWGTSTIGAGLSAADSDARVRAVTADIATLRTALKDTSATQSTITNTMKLLNAAFKQVKPEQLRGPLGSDYATLERIFGNNDAKIKRALNGASGTGGTAPGGGTGGATPGTPGTGGTPGTAPPQPPAQPAASPPPAQPPEPPE